MSIQSNQLFPRFGTPTHVGRGRGMPTPIPFSVDSFTPGVDLPSLEAVSNTSVHDAANQHTSSHLPQVTSTPNPISDNPESVADQMRTVIQEIGHQLADSIMSRMQSHNTVAPDLTVTQNVTSTLSQPSRVSDVSQVQVVTQRKVKEPPSFVGDGSDSIKVHEWEDLMRAFMKKSNVRVEEQAEEILVHLRGKAKDVVKFGIRNSNIDMHAQPDMIYGLLRKHFSCTRPYAPLLSSKEDHCTASGKLTGLYTEEDCADRLIEPPTSYEEPDMLDIGFLYESHSSYIGSTIISSKKLIFQGSQRIAETDSLFYTPVLVKNGPTFKALLDSGSMACTISESAVESLLQQYPDMTRDTADDYVIVGCGGHRVSPKDMYDLDVTVYGCRMVVPVMVVPGQTEQMILGSNAIKHILTQLKSTDGYWRLVSSPDNGQTDDHCQFLSLLSNTERWRGECIPDKVGTVKVKSCVTLKPQSEHLVWGKLPESAVMSVGSTVVVEPTQSKARPKQILVGRVITPLWGDRWLPVKVINPTDRTVVLRRNAKIADVSPCIAVEDLPKAEEVKCNMQCVQSEDVHLRSEEDMVRALEALGLQDIDLKSCEVSLQWKDKLVHIIEQYEAIFSRHKMDCGEAKEFVHRIHLVDDKPFQMVFARLKEHNLKLAPKKCFFLRRTVKFLGHVISEDGVRTDPEKVRAINDLQVTGLMESDGKTPCPSKIRSFLGMVMYYQSFIEACSAKAKPLFRLTVEPEVFRVSNNCQAVVDDGGEASDEPVWGAVTPDTRGSVAPEEVAAILNAQSTGGVSHVIGTDAAFSLLQKEDQSAALPQSQLVSRQEQDSTISRVVYFVQRHKRPTKRERAVESRGVIKLLKHWSRLTIQNGMLYKIRKDPQMDKKIFQLIVPDSLKREVLQGLHDSAGHQGQHRTLSLVRQRFFWSGMERDVVNYVQSCQRCIVGKTPEPHSRAPLKNIVTSEPMELVCIDFWTAEQGNKSVDVLVVTDHFSKMAHAFPCKNQTAKQVARRLWNDFFLIYGFPRRIHSDQGANFESKLIKELLEMAGVQKSHTTPYHPMRNGVTERFNRTLGNMIRSLPLQSKAKWPQMLQQLTFCYNCTEHETTGFAPFYLVFGRIPRLPVDVMFQHALTSDTVVSHSDFVSHLKKDLHEAAQIVQRNSLKEQTRHAKLYNRKVKGSPLVVGDRVLIANRGVPGKVADKWESTPYEVISVRPELNVCRVKDCLTGRERVIHRNLLLSVSFLPCKRGVNSEAGHSECDVAAHGSDACPDVPDMMEDSDVRTVNWLMQTGGEEAHSEEEDDLLDRRSDVVQSDSLSVAASSQDSQQMPAEDVDHAAVDGAEGPPQCSEGIVPDTDVTPPEAVRPDETSLDTDAADMSPPDNIPTDIAPPDSNPTDIDSPDTNAPETAIPDTDCPDDDIPGPLAQIDTSVSEGQKDMKGSQKLLKAQMDKAEDLVLVQPTLLFKDLGEHS
ncbi:Retrovirus-related Pol polyprotein from transposon 412 [Merluccius polli]|uniref:Gypsy retrotransposon integrase-like protein 1 n=1 Tax=Merluccius polli TaxID=89951 RepID=A0AA47MC72_MERPO|nr:Retrovirus-related Pol polyprotein from transposon 412 [Merluccius polli]